MDVDVNSDTVNKARVTEAGKNLKLTYVFSSHRPYTDGANDWRTVSWMR
jgi:hypothetical protein